VVCALFLIAVLIYYGADHAWRAYQYGDSTIDAQYPWWPSKLLVPLSFLLLWLRLALSLIGYGRLLIDPTRMPVATPAETSDHEGEGYVLDEAAPERAGTHARGQ
jgi:TRAP-type mannitol/chloroaromatic compound transport system permease small subunit